VKTKEEILEELFYKAETQDWYKPVLVAMETYARQFRQTQVIGSLPSKKRVEVSNMVMKILTENTHIVDGQVRGVIVHGAVEKLTDIIIEMKKQIG